MFMEQTADVALPAHQQDLISEANHRIANNLNLVTALVRQRMASLAGNGRDAYTREEVRDILGEITGRIDAVGRLHRMLSGADSGAPLDVGAYLQQVVSEVVTSMAKKDSIVLHFACELGCRVAPERAMSLGLIATELVVNSVKHAHPAGIQGHIEVQCRRAQHAVVVSISDDGVGLPEGFDSLSRTHSGMRLVKALAEQIGAKLDFDSGSLGLRCDIVAPAATPVAEAAE